MELEFLYFYLGISFVLAPLMTRNFFLRRSQSYSRVHKLTLAAMLIGVGLDWSFLTVAWPLFCAFGFILYLKNERGQILSARGLAGCIPFTFSLISSLWFVAGTNDFKLLGYNQNWSFYAALHSGILGWLFIGCVTFLARRANANRFYLCACYLSLPLFLLVAFGINGVPFIKRVGLFGFSILVPLSIGLFFFEIKKAGRPSWFLAFGSLLAVALAMTIATLNEFGALAPRLLWEVPSMTLTHGFLNAVVVAPFFYFAILLQRRA